MSGEPPSDQEHNSVTGWFAGLRAGDADAVRHLWDRYAKTLIGEARKQLGGSPRRAADEEDVVVSVFASLCRGAAAGRFDDIRNRDDLWWLLLAMTHRKAVSQIRHETAARRGGGKPDLSLTPAQSNSETQVAYAALISDDPTPEYLLVMEEECGRLLDRLRNETLRRIAMLRVEGYTVAEVAEHMGLAKRSVERKLNLIRETWSAAVAAASSESGE